MQIGAFAVVCSDSTAVVSSAWNCLLIVNRYNHNDCINQVKPTWNILEDADSIHSCPSTHITLYWCLF